MNAQNKHAKDPLFSGYTGRVMCGYQGWFRAEGDPSGIGWGHFGHRGKFDASHITIDIWPDMTEYEKSYKTSFTNADGSKARIFSSVDKSTSDLHFKWMKEYGIDGVFMQRFFSYLRNENSRKTPDMVIKNAFEASQKHERAIAIMYDLSGLRAGRDDCSTIIDDWKHLVDDLKVTSYGTKQTYLFHNGKPLVAIWGIGFPDRPYDIHKIKLDSLLNFLKNDPVYGGCSIMIGIPTYFRNLEKDCINDPYMHEIIRSVDIIMPWMVGRFNSGTFEGQNSYAKHVTKDIIWCDSIEVDYVPCVYPGFSWYNLSKVEFGGIHEINQIPRYKGRFIWQQITSSIESGATMLYVAMFDEIDEATAIFKCTNNPPVDAKFIDYEGLPSDYYLKIIGQAGKMLRKEVPVSKEINIKGNE